MNRSKAFLNIGVYFIFQFIVASVLAFILVNNGLDVNFYTFELFSLIMLSIFIILIILNYQYINEQIKKHLTSKITYLSVIVGYILILGSNIIVVLLRILFLGPDSLDISSNEEAVRAMLENQAMVTQILIVGIVAPFVEEIIFRSSVMGVISKNKVSKSIIPYFVMAFIFAFIHEPGIIFSFSGMIFFDFLSYFSLALIISLLYKYTEHNLLAVFLLHFVNNTMSVLLIGMT